ncbi:MAG: right-handed parallel beta-helix repeat-containing protein, partial [Polyangiaceae bacterium]
LTIAHSVHVVGHCAAQVTIAASAGVAPGVSIATASSATLSGVTITGHSPGISISGGGSLIATGVVLDANSGAGAAISGSGSAIEIDDSVIRSTTAVVSPAAKGSGVNVSGGAHATVQRSAVIANTEVGIYATDASTKLTVADTIVTDTNENAASQLGLGIEAGAKTTVEIDRSFVARNHEAGIVAAALGSAHVVQSVVANNVPSADGFGHGLTLAGGSALVEESPSSKTSTSASPSKMPRARFKPKTRSFVAICRTPTTQRARGSAPARAAASR